MKELLDRILAEGRVIGEEILKVDTFLNQPSNGRFDLGAQQHGEMPGSRIRRVAGVPCEWLPSGSSTAILTAPSKWHVRRVC